MGRKGLNSVFIRKGLIFIFIMMLGLGRGFISYSESKGESSVIESISIKFTDNYGEAEEILQPTVTVSGNGVSLNDVEYETDEDQWKPGKKVKATISIEAEDGKIFKKNWNKESCTIQGKNAFYAGGSVNDDGLLEIRVNYRPCTVLGTTDLAGWDTGYTKACWRDVDYAPGYEVVLYANDQKMSSKKVTVLIQDFSEYMKDGSADYYFEVRAIPMTTDEKLYLKEGDWVMGDSSALPAKVKAAGTEVVSSYNAPNSQFTAGSVAVSSDETQSNAPGGTSANSSGAGGTSANSSVAGGIPENNSFYNTSGSNKNGWTVSGDKWKYLSEGNYLQGWNYINDSWYFFDKDKDMATGLLKDQTGNTYYLGTDGRMRTGWRNIDGSWHYFGMDGKMMTGYLYDKGKLYYLKEDGTLLE